MKLPPVELDDCPFCLRIAAGEYDGTDYLNQTVTFVPLNPVVEGHRLFVPRIHAAGRSIAHSTSLAWAYQMATAHVLETYIDANVIQSFGSDATQTIEHAHVHVVPRRPDDGLQLPWTGQQR